MGRNGHYRGEATLHMGKKGLRNEVTSRRVKRGKTTMDQGRKERGWWS